MAERYSGQNVVLRIGNSRISFETVTLDIDDSTSAAMNDGRPNGFTRGEVKASGQLVADLINFKRLNEEARSAGSWRALQRQELDINFFGDNGSERQEIIAYGCILMISGLGDFDKSSSDKSKYTIDYQVCGKRFIDIDGVPYLDPEEIEFLS